MRVLLDTNVVLDYLLDREPFAEAAAGVWEAHRQRRIEAFISAITPINIFYIARKLKGVDSALAITRALIVEFKIITLSESVLKHAISTSLKDYEDAVQIASAILSNLDAIVTRNLKDYSTSQLQVYTPLGLLKVLS
jgi:predicted nucleic acid-binding protein